MERLENVIEKVKELHDGDNSGISFQSRGSKRTTSRSPAEVQKAWTDLEPLELTGKLAKKNRLVSYFGGRAAAPYDMLRTRIIQKAATHGWRRIAITSPDSGCGKSTTAANVGFSLERQRDIRALVIDLDMRRAGLSKFLGQRPEATVADLLEGDADFASVGRRHGTTVAFGLSNPRVENPAELLQSARTSDVLKTLEDTYEPDLILFDMPPLMASDDNFAFLRNVDCALIIAAAEHTDLDRIDFAERQVGSLTEVMGIVLNKARYVSKGAFGYEYNYY